MRFLIVSICILGFVGMVIGITAWSATTGTISATVTARNISINRTSNGTVAFGTLDLSATTTTDPASDIPDTETFNNNGSQAKFNIMTANTTGGSTPWTPAAAVGSSDQYVLAFTTTTVVSWQILQTASTYETASSTVDAGTSLNIYLQFQAPSASTEYVQKTVPITVQATTP